MSGRPALTAAGQATLAGSAVAYLAGWSLGYPELNALAAAGFLAVLTAFVWVRRVARVQVTRRIHRTRVSVGDDVQVDITVTNPHRRPSATLWANDHFAGTVTEVLVPRLAPGEVRAVGYVLTPVRRGVFDVGPLSVARQDPLGLVRAERVLADTEVLWVLPRTYPIAPLASGRMPDLEGPNVDRAEGSITFHSLREYVPGDDLRRIHWRSSARTGTLLVRRHVDASQPRSVVVLDVGRHAYDEETFESAIEVAASIVKAAVGNHHPVRVVTTSGEAILDRNATGSTRGSYDRFASLDWTRTTDVGRAAGSHAAGLGSLVVVTGRPSPDVRTALAGATGPHGHAVLVEIGHDLEPHASVAGGLQVIQAPDGPSFAAVWNGVV